MQINTIIHCHLAIPHIKIYPDDNFKDKVFNFFPVLHSKFGLNSPSSNLTQETGQKLP